MQSAKETGASRSKATRKLQSIDDFTEEEWNKVLEIIASEAAVIVLTMAAASFNPFASSMARSSSSTLFVDIILSLRSTVSTIPSDRLKRMKQ